METKIKIETGALEVHPLAASIKLNSGNPKSHFFTMKNYYQVNPISVITREVKPFFKGKNKKNKLS